MHRYIVLYSLIDNIINVYGVIRVFTGVGNMRGTNQYLIRIRP